jgi:excisionase family DNA binding protein
MIGRTKLGRGDRIRTSDILRPNPRNEIAADGSGLQVSGDDSGFRDDVSSPLQQKAAIAKDFAPILLPVAPLPGHRDRLLSVSEVSELLTVSDATVYALCARGILAHVRVLNAIRVAPAALNALLTSPHQRGGSDG